MKLAVFVSVVLVSLVDGAMLLGSAATQMGLMDYAVRIAARQGRMDRVRAFISKGVDLNLVDATGMTPYDFALKAERLDIAAVLLRAMKGVNGRGRGETPIHLALESENKDLVVELIKEGATLHPWGRSSGNIKWLERAMLSTDFPMVLFQSSGLLLIINVTPVHVAAARGDLQEIASLRGGGYDLNARARQYSMNMSDHPDAGVCPIHIAALFGHEEVVRYLLDNGVKAVTSTRTHTPLGSRIATKNTDDLLSHVALHTAIGFAAINGNTKIIQMLSGAGAELDQAMRIAIDNRDLPLVKFLVENGANLWKRVQLLNDVFGKGLTPLEFAEFKSNLGNSGKQAYNEIATYLRAVMDWHFIFPKNN